MKILLLFLLVALQTGCTGLPKGMKAVEQFDADRYLGTWYEIARLDHSFERGLEQVSATYSMRDDGGIKVLNKGYSVKNKTWKEAVGKAYFVNEKTTGHLKVSFFGPFYGSYIIFKMDEVNYQYAFVSSYNHEYLWLLSRTPEISNEVKQDFISTAAEYGFKTGQLIFVNQKPIE
ncbi:lipocalin [Psychromonas sp. RZ22]|uniref:lipocalin family protein n=1 Tax=Psychromonas algarum TaxID=2555643 RepID=UPI0010679E95|nr:lipocalin family protein [Psychromonas sp. RZ22]TEW53989.1 lipocalin [Psychromonas sp. RZ22]